MAFFSSHTDMAEAAVKRVYREVMSIDRRSLYNNLARVTMSEQNPLEVRVVVTPTEGFYASSTLEFVMIFPETYPDKAPTINAAHLIFHPNVSLSPPYHVCFSMVDADYNRNYQVEHFVNGLLYLLDNPAFDSCLNAHASHAETFPKLVRDSLAGGLIFRRQYPYRLPLDPELDVVSGAFHALKHTDKYFKDLQVAPNMAVLDLDAELLQLLPDTAGLHAVKAAFDLMGPPLSLALNCRRAPVTGTFARDFNIPVDHVLKNVVLRAGDDLIVVYVLGRASIDLPALSAALGVELEVMPAEQFNADSTLGLLGRVDGFSRVILDKPLVAFDGNAWFSEGKRTALCVSGEALAEHFTYKAAELDMLDVPRMPTRGELRAIERAQRKAAKEAEAAKEADAAKEEEAALASASDVVEVEAVEHVVEVEAVAHVDTVVDAAPVQHHVVETVRSASESGSNVDEIADGVRGLGVAGGLYPYMIEREDDDSASICAVVGRLVNAASPTANSAHNFISHRTLSAPVGGN